MNPRRFSGVLLTAVLLCMQAGPLTASVCSESAMSCCNGKMCPKTKKVAASHTETPDCGAMHDSDKSDCCCSAAPLSSKLTPSVHATLYLVAPLSELTAFMPPMGDVIVLGCVHPNVEFVPDSPPPRNTSV